jgi:O-methyltransferase
MRRLIQGLLALFGLRIARTQAAEKPAFHAGTPDLWHKPVHPNATYSPWLNDQAFLKAYGAVREATLVDVYRCYELWSLAGQCKAEQGCFLEVGVWRGGTGALLAASTANAGQRRTVYLADTFEGVVKAGAQDTRYQGGEHADTSEGAVKALVESMGLQGVKILKGIFPNDTAAQVAEPVALLHCDVDVYGSAKDVVEWALPRMAKGGVIVFDDYGFQGCEGITRYVNELRENPGLLFIHNLNGHAILMVK